MKPSTAALAALVAATVAATGLTGAGTAASRQSVTSISVIGVARGPGATIEQATRRAELLARKARGVKHGQVWEVVKIEVIPSNPHPRETRVIMVTTTGGG